MLCCAMAALGALAVHRRIPPIRPGRAVAVVTVLLLSIFSTQHFSHYMSRAEANDRTLLAEIAAQPLCSGQSGQAIAATDQEGIAPIASARSS